jgi:hypothetical protein
MILALVLLAAIAAGIFWYRQSLHNAAQTKKVAHSELAGRAGSPNGARRLPLKKALAHKLESSSDTEHKYHAVSILCKDGACSAAKEMARTRFLTQAAPVLPLPSCDAAHCHCAYAHHRDRRSEDDERRSVHGLQTELYPQTTGNERRQKRNRRKKIGV